MTTCKTVKKEVLTDPIEVRIEGENLRFEAAKLIADQKAMETASDPMLLAWYDSYTGRYSPDVERCSEHKPGWIVYAEAGGGNITIDINNEAYIFIYCDLMIFPYYDFFP